MRRPTNGETALTLTHTAAFTQFEWSPAVTLLLIQVESTHLGGGWQTMGSLEPCLTEIGRSLEWARWPILAAGLPPELALAARPGSKQSCSIDGGMKLAMELCLLQ
jgi:hypothetical protein